MPRPRNIMPTVRRRRLKNCTVLRVWYLDRWHKVGHEGDAPSEVRARVLAVIATVPKPAPKPVTSEGLTIAKLFAAFLASDSAPRSVGDRNTIKRAGVLLAKFCGANTLAATLNAEVFEEWRDHLCSVPATVYRGKSVGTVELPKTISAEYVVRLMARVRRVYRWGGKRRLVPAGIAADLLNVDRLQSGKARLRPAPKPITPAEAAAVIPHLMPIVRDMLLIQRATGMRPCEIWRMRPRDVHRSGSVAVDQSVVDLDAPAAGGCWLYLPAEHKTASRGITRAIALPKSIQPVLAPYLERDPAAYCFSPREQELRRGLKLRGGTRAMRDHFDTQSYTRSIQYACRRAGITPWAAYRIRHLSIFEVAARDGARAAQLFAGHADLTTTSRYLAFDAATLFAAAAGR